MLRPVGAPGFTVTADGAGVASRAGTVLLRELASVTGLADQVTSALADTYRAPWLLDLALEQLPEHVRPGAPDAPKILVRSDSAGATHAFAAHCREKGVGFSFGFGVDVTLVSIADAITNNDGTNKDGARLRHAFAST